jgi:hypothetical protein
VSRVRANLAALATLRTIQREARPATAEEQRVLARWSGWGAVPEVFDQQRNEFAWARTQLTEMLDEQARLIAVPGRLVRHAGLLTLRLPPSGHLPAGVLARLRALPAVS